MILDGAQASFLTSPKIKQNMPTKSANPKSNLLLNWKPFMKMMIHSAGYFSHEAVLFYSVTHLNSR